MEGGFNTSQNAGSSVPQPPSRPPPRPQLQPQPQPHPHAHPQPQPQPPLDRRGVKRFQEILKEVKNVLNKNKKWISDITQNLQSKHPQNLKSNVTLIRQLDNNLKLVVEIYASLPSYLITSREASLADGSNSSGKGAGSLKRPMLELQKSTIANTIP